MIGKTFLFALVAVGLRYFLMYRDWLQWSQSVVFNVRPGHCQLVGGDQSPSEDVVHAGNGIVLITSGFNFEGAPGKMKVLDLNKDRLEAVTADIRNAPHRADFLASPHGMTTWRDTDTDQLFVYVLTHPKKEDRIEVFEFRAPRTLVYMKTITDPSFAYMNDLIAVGKDQFYITYYWMFRDKFYIFLENLFWISPGKIMFYNGYRAREVASGFIQSNGISVSPDMQTVYMAEWNRKILHAFRREPSNNLVKIWEKYMDTGIDNIDVDPYTGDLWIGCHPITYKIIDFYNIFKQVAPSQAIRVKIRNQEISEIEEIFADDGSLIQKSTVAIYVNGTLVVGSVSEETVTCDVQYLSP